MSSHFHVWNATYYYKLALTFYYNAVCLSLYLTVSQKKFEDRLHKWPKETLIDLCHFFAVKNNNKAAQQTKNDLAEKLLKFLASPSIDLVMEKVVFRRKILGAGGASSSSAKKSSKSTRSSLSKKKVTVKKGKPTKAKKSKTSSKSTPSKKKSLYKEWDTDEEEEEESSEPEEEEEEEEEEEVQSDDEEAGAASEEEQLLPKKKAKGKDGFKKNSGKMPTDKEIKEWVEHYVGCFNLNMVTTNHALTTAGDKFQCNMMDKKPMIKELLKDAIFDQM
jgi:hypothetical protein